MGTTATREERACSADEYVTRLARTVEQMGYVATIVEPSTRLTVSLPHGREFTNEMLTLRPDANEQLMWWWSWGTPINHAEEIAQVAAKVINVVEVTRI
jgi:hypothetical protein